LTDVFFVSRFDHCFTKTKKNMENFEEGDLVLCTSTGQVGEVVEVDYERERCVVEIQESKYYFYTIKMNCLTKYF